MKNINSRNTEYNIDDLFLKRYSPRAMSGESVLREELMTLFDAARWAPSAMNFQPWRFLYSMKGSSDFELFLSFIKESNQVWCKNSGVIIIVFSKNKTQDGKVNPFHSFDTGAAWENLALQGTQMNLVVHPLGGFEPEMIRSSLNVSEDYSIEAMIVVGKHGKIEDLPEKLQEREKPSGRNNLEQIVFEGRDGIKKFN